MKTVSHSYLVNFDGESVKGYICLDSKNTGRALFNEIETAVKHASESDFAYFQVADLGPNDESIEER